MSSQQDPVIKFSNEESKANIRYKLAQNLVNLIELTKSTVKSSESSELFRNCFKNFIPNEQILEASGEHLNKIEIISSQLNYQVQTLHTECDLLKEICNQIDSIQRKHV